jgi:aryl-alcohol dehydrogenase-like predicted oxidoreductase
MNGDEGDAVIIGASTLDQFRENIEYCEKKGTCTHMINYEPPHLHSDS